MDPAHCHASDISYAIECFRMQYRNDFCDAFTIRMGMFPNGYNYCCPSSAVNSTVPYPPTKEERTIVFPLSHKNIDQFMRFVRKLIQYQPPDTLYKLISGDPDVVRGGFCIFLQMLHDATVAESIIIGSMIGKVAELRTDKCFKFLTYPVRDCLRTNKIDFVLNETQKSVRRIKTTCKSYLTFAGFQTDELLRKHRLALDGQKFYHETVDLRF